MKKRLLRVLLSLCLLITCSNLTYAIGGYGYHYADGAIIYTNVSMPQGVSKNGTSLKLLKKGESSSASVFRLVEIGDAGLNAAMRNGGIKKVHFVDTEINKVFIPLFFLPLLVKETKTVVYGE